MAASILGINLQKSLNKIVNDTINRVAVEAETNCYAPIDQRINFQVKGGGKVITSGDLALQQNTAFTLQCLQNQENSAELLSKLKTELTDELTNEIERSYVDVGSVNMQDVQRQVENTVENYINLSTSQKCIANVNQVANISIGPEAQVLVGQCAPELIEALSENCKGVRQETALAYGILNNKDASEADKDAARKAIERNANSAVCNSFETCADKVGNFLLSQGVTSSVGCNQVQKISAELANFVENEVTTTVGQTVKNPITSTIWGIVAIVGGIILLLIVIFLIVFFVMKANKDKQAKANQARANQARAQARARARARSGSQPRPATAAQQRPPLQTTSPSTAASPTNVSTANYGSAIQSQYGPLL